MRKDLNGVRISFAAQMKPVPVAGSIISKKNSVTLVSKVFQYRTPEIIRAKTGWYVKYYFRIPVEVRPFYNNQEWKRFRVKEDMNRRKGQEREEYAQWLRASIEESLKNGYNPFKPENEEIIEGQVIEKKELGAKDAIQLFLKAWEKRGLEKASLDKYKRTANRLIEWLEMKNIPYKNIQEITVDHIEQFLNDLKKKQGFSNREYNNQYDFTRTIFNFLLRKKFIPESPCAGIKKQKSKSKKHRYYDAKSLEIITKAMDAKDPYIGFAFQTVYYLCIRSEKEMMFFKVGNILWEQNKILLDVGKGNSERYIPMDTNIKEILLKRGIDKYPADYYVFGINGEPSRNHFGFGFLSKRFRKVREASGLSSDFTLYSAKHTRVIHLKQDNLPDADIMSVTGHKDFTAYARYLRDLGVDADPKKINAVSRKI